MGETPAVIEWLEALLAAVSFASAPSSPLVQLLRLPPGLPLCDFVHPDARLLILFHPDPKGGADHESACLVPVPRSAVTAAGDGQKLAVTPLDLPVALFSGGYDEEGGHIELTPEQLKATGIKLVQAGPAQIRENLPLYGVIAPNAERVREVAARFPGVIQSVAKKIGDPVREGETLATVEANESLQTYAVTAPLSGVVTARNANPGEQTGDKTLFTVADLSTVWVELSLFPRDVAKVRIGQGVRVKNNEV